MNEAGWPVGATCMCLRALSCAADAAQQCSIPIPCSVSRARITVSTAFCSTYSSSALLPGKQFLFVLKLVTYKRPFVCIVVPQ